MLGLLISRCMLLSAAWQVSDGTIIWRSSNWVDAFITKQSKRMVVGCCEALEPAMIELDCAGRQLGFPLIGATLQYGKTTILQNNIKVSMKFSKILLCLCSLFRWILRVHASPAKLQTWQSAYPFLEKRSKSDNGHT